MASQKTSGEREGDRCRDHSGARASERDAGMRVALSGVQRPNKRYPLARKESSSALSITISRDAPANPRPHVRARGGVKPASTAAKNASQSAHNNEQTTTRTGAVDKGRGYTAVPHCWG